jgi:hypothetical protein
MSTHRVIKRKEYDSWKKYDERMNPKVESSKKSKK